MSTWRTLARRVTLVSAAALLLSLGACKDKEGDGSDGDESKEEQSTTEEPVQRKREAASTDEANELATYIPGEAVGAVVFQGPKPMIEKYTGWLRKKRDEIKEEGVAEENGIDLEKYEKQLTERFGFNPYKADEWKNVGIDWSSPVVGGFFTEDGLMTVVRIKDEKKFEKFAKNLGDTDEFSTEEIDGQTLKTAAEDLKWCYSDDVAVFGFGAENTPEAMGKRVAASCKSKPEGESLADQDGFTNFRNDLLAYHGAAMYFSPSLLLEEADMEPKMRKWMSENLTSTGLAFDYDGTEIAFRGWGGLSSEATSKASKLFKAKKTVDWKKFASADTLAAARLSLNPKSTLAALRKTMTERDLKKFNQGLKQMSQATGGKLDVEKDVINKLSGQIGLFLYDVQMPEKMNGMAALQMASSLKYLGVVQFESADARDKIIDQVGKLMAAQRGGQGGGLERKPLETADGGKDKSIEVVQIPAPMAPKMYLYQDLAAFAPNTMDASKVQAYLKGEHKGEKLGDGDDKTVAKRVSSQNHMTGLYVQHKRVADKLKKVSATEPFSKLFAQLEGQLVQLRADDSGFYYESVATLNPDAPAYTEVVSSLGDAFSQYINAMQSAGMGGQAPNKKLKLDGAPGKGGGMDKPKLKLDKDLK